MLSVPERPPDRPQWAAYSVRPRGGKEQEEMMKDRLYNPLKLSAYRPLFGGKRVLICGAGAVGSNVAEALVKMGCSLDLLDFDNFTLENAAKHSCLVRTPEDVGQNKARALPGGCSRSWKKAAPQMGWIRTCAGSARRHWRTTMWWCCAWTITRPRLCSTSCGCSCRRSAVRW